MPALHAPVDSLIYHAHGAEIFPDSDTARCASDAHACTADVSLCSGNACRSVNSYAVRAAQFQSSVGSHCSQAMPCQLARSSRKGSVSTCMPPPSACLSEGSSHRGYAATADAFAPTRASWPRPGRAVPPGKALQRVLCLHTRVSASTCLNGSCAAAAGASVPTRASWARPGRSAQRCRSGCCARCATWARACPATSASPPACTPTSTCSPSASPLWRRAMVSLAYNVLLKPAPHLIGGSSVPCTWISARSGRQRWQA